MKDWKTEYRKELIQVAAVAMAAIQDFDIETTDISVAIFDYIASEVFQERVNQFNKWGSQHRDVFLWNTILTEEVGEVCEASLKWTFRQNEGRADNVV